MPIPVEAANSGSVSHTYCRGKPPLELLMESWLALQSKPGNQPSSRDNMGCTELSLSCCAEIGVPLDLRRVSRNLWNCLKEINTLVCMMLNAGWLWSQCMGIKLHLELICGTPSYFAFLL